MWYLRKITLKEKRFLNSSRNASFCHDVNNNNIFLRCILLEKLGWSGWIKQALNSQQGRRGRWHKRFVVPLPPNVKYFKTILTGYFKIAKFMIVVLFDMQFIRLGYLLSIYFCKITFVSIETALNCDYYYNYYNNW